MFNWLKASLFSVAIFVAIGLAVPASAQIGIIWDVEGIGGWCFLGGANMDNDPGDELVFGGYYNRIVILDGESGSIDWDSGIWNIIRIAGHNLAGTNYGFSPFCDSDGDGKKEISFSGRQNEGDQTRHYLVGFGGTGISSNGNNPIPKIHELSQNYPNPFNPNTTIEYQLTSPGHAIVEIYNILGQKVKILVDEEKSEGNYAVIWDGRTDAGESLASGTYFYQLRVGDYASTKKSLLLK